MFDEKIRCFMENYLSDLSSIWASLGYTAFARLQYALRRHKQGGEKGTELDKYTLEHVYVKYNNIHMNELQKKIFISFTYLSSLT